jgi:hypothetical protein
MKEIRSSKSLNRPGEADALLESGGAQGMDYALSCSSTVGGITASWRGEMPTVYYGITERIPNRLFVTATATAIEQSVERMQAAILGVAGRLPNGVVERYEIRDTHNGDLIVMIRVPCVPRREEL